MTAGDIARKSSRTLLVHWCFVRDRAKRAGGDRSDRDSVKRASLFRDADRRPQPVNFSGPRQNGIAAIAEIRTRFKQQAIGSSPGPRSLIQTARPIDARDRFGRGRRSDRPMRPPFMLNLDEYIHAHVRGECRRYSRRVIPEELVIVTL